jgi:hypothetical protein
VRREVGGDLRLHFRRAAGDALQVALETEVVFETRVGSRRLVAAGACCATRDRVGLARYVGDPGA